VRGRDADCNEIVAARHLDGLRDRRQKRVVAGNHVVCRKRPDDGLRIAFREDGSGETDGRHGIFGTRFAEKVFGEELGKLLVDDADMGGACYDGCARRGGKREETIPSSLDERTALER
jgi:hypothetical protein